MPIEDLPEAQGPLRPELRRPDTRPTHAALRNLLTPRRRVAPLSFELYDRVFNGGFVPRSTEYMDPVTGAEGPMLWRTRELLDAQGTFTNLVSVGAGTGHFDSSLLRGRQLRRYTAIEPNPHHVAALHQSMGGAGFPVNVIPEAFAAHFDHEDLPPGSVSRILNTHCAYFWPDPVAAILRQMQLLDEDGSVHVLHQTEDEGVCPMFRHFSERFGLDWNPEDSRQDHSMSTATISSQLAARGIPHFIGEEEAGLYVDDFHEQGAEDAEGAVWLNSFVMNTDARQFSSAERAEMVKYVRERSVTRHGNRQYFRHPQGFLLVPKSGAESLAIPGMTLVRGMAD